MAIKNKHLKASDYWKLPKKRKDKVSPFIDDVPNQVVRSAHYYKWFGLYGLKAKDSLSQYGIAARCLDLEKFEYECYAPDPDEDDCSIYFITTEDYIEEHLQKSPQLSLFFKDTNVSLREFKLMEITDKLHLICNNFDIIKFLELDIDECFEKDSIKLDDLPSYESKNLPEEDNVAKQEVKTETVETICRKKLELNNNDIIFRVGDMVTHKAWGNGVVKEISLDRSLIGVKFQNINIYVNPNTLELLEIIETKKRIEKGFDRIIPFKDGKYSSEKLAANANLIRRLMRTGGISLGGMIYSPKYGSGIIRYMDSSFIKASFNNVIKTLHIGKDFIQI